MAVAAGADAIGFVFYPASPRYVTPQRAAELAKQIPPFVDVVGLFVNTPRAEVDEFTKRRVFEGLKKHWVASTDELARSLELDRAAVLAALGIYTQAGRAIYDLNKQVYRVRELSREPLPMSKLRFSNEREQAANRLVDEKAVSKLKAEQGSVVNLRLRGKVKDGGRTYEPELTIDADQRIASATCTCNFYTQNKLYKGPCEHILALRISHRRTQG